MSLPDHDVDILKDVEEILQPMDRPCTDSVMPRERGKSTGARYLRHIRDVRVEVADGSVVPISFGACDCRQSELDRAKWADSVSTVRNTF